MEEHIMHFWYCFHCGNGSWFLKMSGCCIHCYTGSLLVRKPVKATDYKTVEACRRIAGGEAAFDLVEYLNE